MARSLTIKAAIIVDNPVSRQIGFELQNAINGKVIATAFANEHKTSIEFRVNHEVSSGGELQYYIRCLDPGYKLLSNLSDEYEDSNWYEIDLARRKLTSVDGSLDNTTVSDVFLRLYPDFSQKPKFTTCRPTNHSINANRNRSSRLLKFLQNIEGKAGERCKAACLSLLVLQDFSVSMIGNILAKSKTPTSAAFFQADWSLFGSEPKWQHKQWEEALFELNKFNLFYKFEDERYVVDDPNLKSVSVEIQRLTKFCPLELLKTARNFFTSGNDQSASLKAILVNQKLKDSKWAKQSFDHHMDDIKILVFQAAETGKLDFEQIAKKIQYLQSLETQIKGSGVRLQAIRSLLCDHLVQICDMTAALKSIEANNLTIESFLKTNGLDGVSPYNRSLLARLWTDGLDDTRFKLRSFLVSHVES